MKTALVGTREILSKMLGLHSIAPFLKDLAIKNATLDQEKPSGIPNVHT